MINKTYIKYILIFSLVIPMVSCIKLDYPPTDFIDDSKAFRNLNDINLGLIGAYAVLDYTAISHSAIVADEVMLPTENSVSNTDAHRWLYSSINGSVTSAYATYYRSIDRVNRVLAGMEALTFNDAEKETSDRYRGELLALRAYCHFELLRNYAANYQTGALGVPYMKVSAIGSPARDPFEVVIANAKADLVAAKALIPASYTDKSHITRTGVAAIQARLALYEKNWADAITYSTEVITAVPLATKAQFPEIWSDASNNEVVWELKRVSTDSRTGDLFYRQTGGIVLYAPSFKLINSFDAVNDVRFPAYIKFDATRGAGKSQYLVNKYIGKTASPGMADVKLFRTGEMYLIRAEARAESTGDAAADLNALRTARITGYNNATFADKPALITAIYSERFKELAFEGHRYYDLRRRNMPIQRLPEDAINTSGALTLLPTQAQYALPLPSQELLVNKNTVQNPNY